MAVMAACRMAVTAPPCMLCSKGCPLAVVATAPIGLLEGEMLQWVAVIRVKVRGLLEGEVLQ